MIFWGEVEGAQQGKERQLQVHIKSVQIRINGTSKVDESWLITLSD